MGVRVGGKVRVGVKVGVEGWVWLVIIIMLSFLSLSGLSFSDAWPLAESSNQNPVEPSGHPVAAKVSL